MILVDGQKAELEKLNGFRQAKKRFDEIGWPIRFRRKESSIVTKRLVDGGTKRRAAPKFIMHYATVPTDNGSSEFWYVKGYPEKRDGQLMKTSKNTGQWYDSLVETFKREEIDLVFFLSEYSNDFLNHYEIIDEEKDARDEMKAIRASANLQRYLAADDSPLAKSPDKLRTVAKAYGISFKDGDSDEKVMLSLYRRLESMEKDTPGVVDEFVKNVGVGDFIELKSYIFEAENDDVLVFNASRKEWSWVDEKSGMPGRMILRVQSKNMNDARNELTEYMTGDPDAKRQLLNRLNIDVMQSYTFDPEKPIYDYTVPELNKLKHFEAVKVLKQVEDVDKSAKGDEVMDRIVKHIKGEIN